LAEQILEFHPSVVVVPSHEGRVELSERLTQLGLAKSDWPELLFGPQALVAIATAHEVQIVVSAIVGVAGLEATYEAVRAGKRVGLANKECLVAAGELITPEARPAGHTLLPIDSEHNAVHQCLRGGRLEEVRTIWLTASGGPF